MKVINVEIKVKQIFKNIAEVTNNGSVIGYLAPSENDEYPVAAILPTGENFGTFDCARCACIKLDMKDSNVVKSDVCDVDPVEILTGLLLTSLLKRHFH